MQPVLRVACFENYLNIKLFDVATKQSKTESRYVQQGSHLAFFDRLQRVLGEFQAYDLQSYLVYPIASFHRLFSTPKPVELDFPRTTYQVDSVAKQIKSLASSFWTGMTPRLRAYWFNPSLNITELAPFLMYIISPDFKPVAATRDNC